MSQPEHDRPVFKQCPMCGCVWDSRDAFLCDPCVEIVGYQVHFEELTAGYFVFNHSCETSLAVVVGAFSDLYDGPVFEDRRTGTEDCPQYCLHEDDLRPCPARCECACVREIIQLVRRWPKQYEASGRPVGC
jgi:hypothetical protein